MTDDDRAVVARLHGAGDLRIGTEPVGRPRPGRGARAGDLGRPVRLGSALVPGGRDRRRRARAVRSCSATSSAASSSMARGRASGSPPIRPSRAGMCEPCRTGGAHLCLDGRFAGFSPTDGALRSLMAWPGRLLHPLPDDDRGRRSGPARAARRRVARARPRAGRSRRRAPVSMAAGRSVCCMIRVLRQAGASVIVATDRLAHRVAAALAMGATEGFIVGEAGRPDPSDARRRRARRRSTSPSRSRATTMRCRTRSQRSGPAGGSCWSASPTVIGPASRPAPRGARS